MLRSPDQDNLLLQVYPLPLQGASHSFLVTSTTVFFWGGGDSPTSNLEYAIISRYTVWGFSSHSSVSTDIIFDKGKRLYALCNLYYFTFQCGHQHNILLAHI